jgi:hypothetical protein
MTLSKIERINTVKGEGGHVVILGAGASIASTLRNPELNGKRLPSMENFIEVVGLLDIVESLPSNLKANNFEHLYSKLHDTNPNSKEIKEIERRVYEYFKDMKLPEEATIYDYLVLSLRPRDLIATFNWDPFLFQAFYRNRKFADPPRVSFLHGNVAVGYSEEDKKVGPVGFGIRATGNILKPTRLLYPVNKKDYTSQEFLMIEWTRIEHWMEQKETKCVTVFGYGAPKSDLEAIQLLKNAYNNSGDRDVEQFEIIDIKSEKEGIETWKDFIYSNHYDYCNNYFESSLARNPRRTFESFQQQNFPETPEEAFSESNPIPADIFSLRELQEWHSSLIDAEIEWKQKNPDFEL